MDQVEVHPSLYCAECSLPFWTKDVRRNTSLINVVNAYKELWKIAREELALAGVPESLMGLGYLDGRGPDGTDPDQSESANTSSGSPKLGTRSRRRADKMTAAELASKLNSGLRRGARLGGTSDTSCDEEEEDEDEDEDTDEGEGRTQPDAEGHMREADARDQAAQDERLELTAIEAEPQRATKCVDEIEDEVSVIEVVGKQSQPGKNNRASEPVSSLSPRSESIAQSDQVMSAKSPQALSTLSPTESRMNHIASVESMIHQAQHIPSPMEFVDLDDDIPSDSDLKRTLSRASTASSKRLKRGKSSDDRASIGELQEVPLRMLSRPPSKLTSTSSAAAAENQSDQSLACIQTIPVSTQDQSSFSTNQTCPKSQSIHVALGPNVLQQAQSSQGSFALATYTSDVRTLRESSPSSPAKSSSGVTSPRKSHLFSPPSPKSPNKRNRVSSEIPDEQTLTPLPCLEMKFKDDGELSQSSSQQFCTPLELIDTPEIVGAKERSLSQFRLAACPEKYSVNSIKIAVSGIPTVERAQLFMDAKRIGVAVGQVSNGDVTHLIVATGPTTRNIEVTALFSASPFTRATSGRTPTARLLFARRTIAYLTALLNGCTIVSDTWFSHFILEASTEAMVKTGSFEEVLIGNNIPNVDLLPKIGTFSTEGSIQFYIKRYFPCYEIAGDVPVGPSLSPRLYRDFKLRCGSSLKLWPRLVYEYSQLCEEIVSLLAQWEQSVITLPVGSTLVPAEFEKRRLLTTLSAQLSSRVPLPFIPPLSWFDDICPPTVLLAPYAIAFLGPFKDVDPKEEELRTLVELAGGRYVKLEPFISTFQLRSEMYSKFGVTETGLLSACQSPFVMQLDESVRRHLPREELNPTPSQLEQFHWLTSRSGAAEPPSLDTPSLTLHPHALRPMYSLKLLHSALQRTQPQTKSPQRRLKPVERSQSSTTSDALMRSDSIAFDSSQPGATLAVATGGEMQENGRTSTGDENWWESQETLSVWERCFLRPPSSCQMPVLVVASHLLASDSPKLRPFLRSRIPIVAAAWLMDCISSGRRLDFAPYTPKAIQEKLKDGHRN